MKVVHPSDRSSTTTKRLKHGGKYVGVGRLSEALTSHNTILEVNGEAGTDKRGPRSAKLARVERHHGQDAKRERGPWCFTDNHRLQ